MHWDMKCRRCSTNGPLLKSELVLNFGVEPRVDCCHDEVDAASRVADLDPPCQGPLSRPRHGARCRAINIEGGPEAQRARLVAQEIE